eukprot:4756321-Heterocapsa_arctica.AAC.1
MGGLAWLHPRSIRRRGNRQSPSGLAAEVQARQDVGGEQRHVQELPGRAEAQALRARPRGVRRPRLSGEGPEAGALGPDPGRDCRRTATY